MSTSPDSPKTAERIKVATFVVKYVGTELGKAAAKIAAALVIVMCTVVGIQYAYTTWYPHVIPTQVFTNGNWMQGEKRSCIFHSEQQAWLDCTVKQSSTELEPHNFDVRYTGTDPADQPKNKQQLWTCVRTADSISCTFRKVPDNQ